jgi:4-nitrophenyl phosphatase
VGKLHFLLDGDGVLWRASETLPGAAEFLDFLRAQGISYSLITNNSAYRREEVAANIATRGLQFPPEDIFNTNYLAGCYLHDNHADECILAIGSDALTAELRSRGLKVLTVEESLPAEKPGAMSIKPLLRGMLPEEPAVVLVGLDVGVTYRRLALACRLLEDGAQFIATNRDYTFPMEGGYLLPGNGAVIDVLERVTGVQAVSLGKPETHLIELIERERGIPRGDMVIVGDRVETDIDMAERAGIRSVLVLTGVTKELPEHWPVCSQPTFIMRDLNELRERFSRCFG